MYIVCVSISPYEVPDRDSGTETPVTLWRAKNSVATCFRCGRVAAFISIICRINTRQQVQPLSYWRWRIVVAGAKNSVHAFTVENYSGRVQTLFLRQDM